MPVDCKELENLRDNLGKMIKNNDAFIKELTLELTRRLLAMLQKATPVDTGFLRDGWFVIALTKTSEGYEAEIANNTNYASYVNYGHRTPQGGWVDGKFFIELSVEELKGITEPLLKKRIEAHLKEAFE